MQYKTKYRKDYTIPSYLIKKTNLIIQVFDTYVRVLSTLAIEKNKNSTDTSFFLHGEELDLEYAKINSVDLTNDNHSITNEGITLYNLPDSFTFTSSCKIYAHTKTSCEGLYKSHSMLSTQCEPEGFRKITYFADRPDIMSEFTVRLEADKTTYPVLLSNGNQIEQGDLPDNKHFVTWHDPFLKPAHLFAVVMGDLARLEDSFTTKSNRNVKLYIYTEPQWIKECDHAMTSLKQAMAWDEKVYNREYDLDTFSIVAVRDFNMGAMENKSLNIFNASCILGTGKTATNNQLERIQGIVAHEYFHNWTGNRINCRDWFQLTLKEGLTIYRDQEFSADHTSRIIQRIQDVNQLRTFQFPEDASQLAHPIRPDSYREINNFYTVTVYEKGAEVIRMLAYFLGEEKYQKGMQYYFTTYDGQAVTCDDFIYALEQGSGQDLSLFKTWYEQAGTPKLTVTTNYDAHTQTYSLQCKQTCEAPIQQTKQKPFPIPFRFSLLSKQGKLLTFTLDGKEETQTTYLITDTEETITLTNVKEEPILSGLQNFSAPVILELAQSIDDKLCLMKHDIDLFNRYEAAQSLLKQAILARLDNKPSKELLTHFANTIKEIGKDTKLEAGFLAEILIFPSLAEIESLLTNINPILLHQTHEAVQVELGQLLESYFLDCYKKLAPSLTPYTFSAKANGERRLKNLCLRYLVQQQKEEYTALVKDCFFQADNMTDQLATLGMLVHYAPDASQKALEAFALQWKQHPVVMENYFTIQASAPCKTVEQVKELTKSPYFEANNPNKIRSVFSVFSKNLMNFHVESGEGYRFLCDKILEQNKANPQIAARLARTFAPWQTYDTPFQAKIKPILEEILQSAELSPDVAEIVGKSLGK